MNRAELQQLADDRLRDAEVLLAAGRWSAAYYLAGYAIECGLKACVLAHLEKSSRIFEDKKEMTDILNNYFTHDIDKLVKLAELESARGKDIATNPDLSKNWSIVKDWNETSRYRQISAVDMDTNARTFFDAIAANPNGVMLWIKAHW